MHRCVEGMGTANCGRSISHHTVIQATGSFHQRPHMTTRAKGALHNAKGVGSELQRASPPTLF
ncbi:hypothetical protein PSAC2689_80114 [Paraburkholderia sacchari]